LKLWLENAFSPVAVLAWWLILLAIASLFRSRSRWWRVMLPAVAAVYYLLTIPLTANWALGALEQRAAHEKTCGPPPADSTLIVLAGGIEGDANETDNVTRLKLASLRRLISATQLALRTPGSQLVISGGAGGRYREADLMATLSREMGFPASRILIDRKSQTTYQSAVNIAALRADDHHPRYLLTSAFHMPRALASFRHSGQDVCAWPVDFRAINMPAYEMLTPHMSSAFKMSLALHEWVGMWFYRWVKWS